MAGTQMAKKFPTEADFALDHDEDLVDSLVRIESLLAPHALERMRKGCFALVDERGAFTVPRLRLILQLEDHLDWLLRHDLPRLLLWRLDSRRADAIAFSAQTAELWQALGLCLGQFALSCGEWITSEDHETGLLPLTIAVALHCHVHEMRWRAQAEQKCALPLKALHRIYAIAEASDLADERVHPYEAEVDFSISPKEQYVLMLLMADLAERDLPPTQRLVAQHWLSRWAMDVALAVEFDAQKHSMQVNLDSSRGICRLEKPAPVDARFLDIRVIAYRIEELDALLANTNGIDDTASEIAEASEEDLTETISWLERLYHDRSSAFQVTRERASVPELRAVRVICGWNAIQEFVDAASWTAKTGRGNFPAKFPAFGTTGAAMRDTMPLPIIDATFVPPSETRDENNFAQWRLRDISQGGMGLSSTDAADAALPVGTLVMVSASEDEGWVVGRVVRKFEDLDGDATRFGIQVLGHQAVPVKLTPRPAEHLQLMNTLMSSVNAIFLCEHETGGAQHLMLLSGGALASTRRFELKTGAKRFALRTTFPLQSAGAWVLMRFEEDALPPAVQVPPASASAS